MKKGRPLAYTRITYEELGMYVASKASIPVSKQWLDTITGGTETTQEPIKFDHDADKARKPLEHEHSNKIEYELTTFE